MPLTTRQHVPKEHAVDVPSAHVDDRRTSKLIWRARPPRLVKLLVALLCLAQLARLADFAVRYISTRKHNQQLAPPDPRVVAAAAMGARAVLEILEKSDVGLHIIVEPRYGLGNRLRTIASAMSIAAASKRQVLVAWASDAHCNCSLRALLAPGDHDLPFALLETALVDNTGDLPHKKYQAMNYMPGEPGSIKREWIYLDANRHLFARSAYRLAHDRGEWRYAKFQLRRMLIERPNYHLPESANIYKLSAVLADSSMVGVHVRGTVDAISNYDANGANGTESLRVARERGRWPAFIERMSREPESTRFYLAADSADAYDGLSKAFPGRIIGSQRPGCEARRCDTDRSCEALTFALVDILNLARTKFILGSGYSSFTEVAKYTGSADWVGTELTVEEVGADF